MSFQPPKQNKGKFFYAVFLGVELGFLIALPLVGFVILGMFLDKKFQKFPFFLFLFTFFGLISTVFEVRHFLLPFLEKGRKINSQKQK